MQANNGLVSATTSVGVLYGGTGLTTAPNYGQLLLGQSNGTYALIGTSSLGLGSGTVSSGTQGQFAFYNAGGAALTATSSLYLAQNGYIGIGTTSPFTTLAVNGSGYFTDTLTARIIDNGGQVNNVKAFGAKGDGVTDDTAAIQAAIDALPNSGGVVYLPTGTYNITSTINLLRCCGAFKVQFLGATMLSTVLKWNGSTSGTVILARHIVGFKIANLSLLNNVARGTTQGIHLTSDDPFGSDTGPGTIDTVEICGFHEGFAVGDSAGNAASEILYLNLTLDQNDTGVVLRGSNSLNHQFHNLGMANNGTGLEAVEPDSVYVYGGSASNSTVQDFAFLSSGQFYIAGYRSENPYRFVTFGPDAGNGASSPTEATISGVEVYHIQAPDGRAIRLNKMGHYTITGSTIQPGHIYLGSGSGNRSSLTVSGNTFDDTQLVEVYPGDNMWDISTIRNSTSMTGVGNLWPDRHYLLLAGGVTKEVETTDNTSSGNIGFGTTTPWGRLSITGAGTGTGIAFATANSNNSPKFVIQDNGWVGIGTTSPSTLLGLHGGIGVNTSQLYLAANGNVGELPRPLLKYARQASLVDQPTLPGLGLQYCCSSCA